MHTEWKLNKQESSKLKSKRQNKTDAIEEDERGTEHYKNTILI